MRYKMFATAEEHMLFVLLRHTILTMEKKSFFQMMWPLFAKTK